MTAVATEAEATSFPIVTLCGSPHQRGRQHGRLFADRIAGAIAALRETTGAARWEEVQDRIRHDMPMLIAIAPDALEEIAGIAEGARVAVEDTIAHIGFEYFKAPPRGCSALALASGDGAIVAQNWDAPAGESARLALFLHSDVSGFQAAIVGPVGGLAWVGVNRHGLALVNNDLLLHGRNRGIPSQIVRRLCLAEASVEAALDVLVRVPPIAGRAFLLGDAAGAVAAVEVSALDGVHVLGRRGPLLHTNHALVPALTAVEDKVALDATYPSSQRRLQRMRAARPAPRTVDAVKGLLRDEDGAPNSVCKHLSADEPTQTTFSIVMETAARRIYLAIGRPSASPYMELRFG